MYTYSEVWRCGFFCFPLFLCFFLCVSFLVIVLDLSNNKNPYLHLIKEHARDLNAFHPGFQPTGSAWSQELESQSKFAQLSTLYKAIWEAY